MSVPSAGSFSPRPQDPENMSKSSASGSSNQGELKGRKITSSSESSGLEVPPTPKPTKDKKFDFNVNTSYVSKSKPSNPLKTGGIHYAYEELMDLCQTPLFELACTKYDSLEIDHKYDLLEDDLIKELNIGAPVNKFSKTELNELLEKTNICTKVIDYSYDFDMRNLMDDPLAEVPKSFGDDPREYLKNTIRLRHLEIIRVIQSRQIEILSKLMTM